MTPSNSSGFSPSNSLILRLTNAPVSVNVPASKSAVSRSFAESLPSAGE